MQNNLLKKLESLILKLEIKLNKAKNMKSKLELLYQINSLRKQYQELLELENKSLEKKYDDIISEKIIDVKKQIQKDTKKYLTDYVYNFSNQILIKDSDYLSFIDKFWIDEISNLDPEQAVLVRFMVQMSDTSARTFNKTEIIKNTPECLNNFKEIIGFNLNNIYAHYLAPEEDNMILGFIMRYRILSPKFKDTVTKKSNMIKKGRIQTTVKIANINYPLSLNPFDFGDHQYKIDNLTYVKKSNQNLLFKFDKGIDGQTIEVSKNNKLINVLKDIFIDSHNNLFKRVINSITYWIKDGKIILKSKQYNPKFIEKTIVNKNFGDNIYTGDIETLTKIDDKGKRYFEPYALAYFDGIKVSTYYVLDYNNWEEMICQYWDDLFSLELKNTDIYFHNLSGFDINFILKPLSNMKDVDIKVMLREDKYICVEISKGNSLINIKDSLLLLPSSLMNLSKSFKIQSPKEIFPRKLFESETFPAGYISKEVPFYNYYNPSEVSLDDYNKYKESFLGLNWSLRDETLKYVGIDCIALYQVLIKFGNLIFDRWGIDIKNTPTLPALCFKIYRTHYMAKNTIPIITGIPFRDIKQSYTGGSTDMYIPYGENIWCYDVNSLYPTSMHNFEFPVGDFKSYENKGNLSIMELESLFNNSLFGFIECDVDCPDWIKHPILQIRREVSANNLRTFAPIGTFKGWFHTEEIREAIKLGYKVKIISGYQFQKAEIFKDYVDDLYRIKVEADKNKDMVWRLISKNLMNSLYGRFGMDQYLKNTLIIDKDDKITENLYNDVEVDDIIELDNKLLIQYLPKNYKTFYYQENLDLNISISIASSVTAYSRILMSKFKNNDKFDLYYTDTDSLYVSFNNDLDKLNFENEFVDPLKLGFLKIENLKKDGVFKPYERFYFLGAKFYVGIFNNLIDLKNKTKIRGLQKSYRNLITEDKIKSLLNFKKESIKIQTLKWYKNVSDSKIILEKRPYNLDISSNKRCLVYKYNSEKDIKLINTVPILMKNNKIEHNKNYYIKDNKLYKELI